MAKKKNEEFIDQEGDAMQENPAIQPEKVEKVSLQPSKPEPAIPRGHVLLAELDSDGNESTLFTVAERGWKQYYSDESKFRLKKKAK